MDGMIEIEVLIPTSELTWQGKLPSPERLTTIALSLSMGIRVMPNHDNPDHAWICLSDNSTWKSPHDYRTTVDKIDGIFRHL